MKWSASLFDEWTMLAWRNCLPYLGHCILPGETPRIPDHQDFSVSSTFVGPDRIPGRCVGQFGAPFSTGGIHNTWNSLRGVIRGVTNTTTGVHSDACVHRPWKRQPGHFVAIWFGVWPGEKYEAICHSRVRRITMRDLLKCEFTHEVGDLFRHVGEPQKKWVSFFTGSRPWLRNYRFPRETVARLYLVLSEWLTATSDDLSNQAWMTHRGHRGNSWISRWKSVRSMQKDHSGNMHFVSILTVTSV